MQNWIEAGDRLLRKLNAALYHVACVMIVGMVLNVVLAVVFNKLLGRAFPVPVDYTGYLLLIAVCLGYAGYQYKNGFVRVTMLTEHFPAKLGKATEIGVFLVLFLFYAFMAYQSSRVGLGALESKQKMISISWEVWPYYFILAFGFIWTALVTAFQCLRYVLTGKSGE